MAVLKIKDANGVWQTVQTLLGNTGGSGSGDSIPRTGNRGMLAGFETLTEEAASVTEVNKNTPDTFLVEPPAAGETLSINVPNETSEEFVNWTKIGIFIYTDTSVTQAGDTEIVLGTQWTWANDMVPTLGKGEVVSIFAIIFWCVGGTNFAIPVKLCSL